MSLRINQNLSGIRQNIVHFKEKTPAISDKTQSQSVNNLYLRYAEAAEKIADAIKSANRVAIVTHMDVDGDAVGSLATMRDMVEAMGKEADAYIVGGYPSQFDVLDDAKKFKIINEDNKEEFTKKPYDLAISVDVPRTYMLDLAAPIFWNAGKRIKIDHHPGGDVTNEEGRPFGDITLVDEKATSTAQVIKTLANSMGVKITPDMAADMYLALVTDSVGLRALKDPVRDYLDCADLAKAGIDTEKIYKQAMDTLSMPMLKVYGKIINNINLSPDGKIAYCIIDKALKKQFPKEVKGDVAGISNTIKRVTNMILTNIEGVKAGVMLIQTNNDVIASLRGNGINVSSIAKQFGGGGHEKAAACKMQETPEEAIKKIINAFNAQETDVRSQTSQ